VVTDVTAAILLLEHDAAIRMVCRVNLESDGYRVVEAETVEEAERLLSTERIGVVVTDSQITKPGDGLQFAAQARADDPDVALILMTRGRSDEPTDFADAYYVKPFDLDDFRATVKQLADRGLGLNRDDEAANGDCGEVRRRRERGERTRNGQPTSSA
jgi:DNA-binding response OmpR family regulator